MAYINYAHRLVQLKIVYCGCGLCGKTTNLQVVHASLRNTQKSELVSLATREDRTLLFDFMSLETKLLNGFSVRFQLYTVPGQAIYTSTRRLVLNGADGVVFVADSQPGRFQENVSAFRDMEANLEENRLSLAQVPYVLQYNKRDMPNAVPLEYLEEALNSRYPRVQAFQSVATTGFGVMETLNCAAGLVVQRFSAAAASSA